MTKKQKQAIKRANNVWLSHQTADAHVEYLLFDHLGFDEDSSLDIFFINRSAEGTLYLIIDKDSKRTEIPVDILFDKQYENVGLVNLLSAHPTSYFH